MATNRGAHWDMTCPKVSAKLVGYAQLASAYSSLLNHPLKSRDEGVKMAFKSQTSHELQSAWRLVADRVGRAHQVSPALPHWKTE